MTKQLSAFLQMISFSEGTARIGNEGYDVLVGSRSDMPILFGSYSRHPRVRIQLRADDKSTPKDEELTSSAAGKYQILARTYDSYSKSLGLTDFSPTSQDAIAEQLIMERGAIPDIEAGRFDHAVGKVANIWASLPGAGYGQHENTIAALRDEFVANGGTLEIT